MKFNRNFMLLLSGQLVSQIGDKFHMIALSFYVLKTTGSSAKMGAVLAASLIPSLILGFFSGAFAVPAIIPTIVDEKNLAAANSKHQFIAGFSTIAGAFLGGIMVSAAGYLWVFVLNALSFILSAFFECFIQIPRTPGKGETKKPQGIWEDMKEGYRYIFTRQDLVVLLFMVLMIHFFVGSIEVIMPVMANIISSDGAKTLGFFQTAFGLGTIMMAVFLSVRTISGKEKATLFSSVFIIGLIFLITGLIKGKENLMTGFYIFMFFLFGCCIICAGISFRTLLQKAMDNEYAGRVFAVAGTIGNGSIPGAMILYGILLEHFSFQGLLMVSGMALMPLSIMSFILFKEKKYGRTGEVLSKPSA
jgi:MFS family permease